MPEPLHSCVTKAIVADGDQLRTGPRWIMARRALLKLYDDHLQCGNWAVAYSEVREAALVSIRSPILRIPGYVLSLRTDHQTYHFGLNGWGQFWQGELPFPVVRSRGRLRMSPISVLARAILIGYLVYLLWTWLAT